MSENLADLRDELRNGLFLSSMMGITDGAFCAQRSAGCAMVQLGAYLAEPSADRAAMGADARSYLPADPAACTAFLAEECRRAKGSAPVRTCLNLASPRLEWALQAAESFLQAGGDLIELNAHGGYARYLALGKLRAMVLPENQPELFRWVQAFRERGMPLIVKVNGQSDLQHLLPVLARLAELDVFAVHVNVRAAKTKKPDLTLVRRVKAAYPHFLLASGYVRSAADVRDLQAAGAAMAGVAEPTIQDAAYILRIAQEMG